MIQPSRFQSFDETSDPTLSAPRLRLLRDRLAGLGLTGFIVPRADAHQNEYVPPSEERLAWLTGFTGSAGLAIVLRTRGAIFVDGRYTVQAREQVDEALFEVVDIGALSPADWLKDALSPDDRIGYDPWLHTPGQVERYARACGDAGAELVATEPNPLDQVWSNRPPPPLAAISAHPAEFAGEDSTAKLARIQAAITRARADALLVSDPHAMAWTFNIRGGDVGHTPLPLGWAVIPAQGRPTLLVDGRKLSNSLRAALSEAADIAEPGDLDTRLDALAGKRVLLDSATAPQRLAARLEAAGAKVERVADPIALLKAVKNAAEMSGTRAAHRRDGAAMCRFLAWFDREAPRGALDEIGAAEALEAFRAETGALRDLSFPSISAAGPNAALPHYRVTRASNRTIGDGLFLIDSGAQYEDGTTDITRTIAVGALTHAMRDRYTRVLKGHIAIATARFPRGVTGAQLDPFARRALWDVGADFDHGTGHGVGSYLSVHEGPQRISKLGTVALEPGMLLSNEPGYYREGHFGIRTENLVLVKTDHRESDERPMLAFETITLAPIDTRPIEPELLTVEERAWLDAYHARVLAEIGRLVDGDTRAWLQAACAPLQFAPPPDWGEA